MNLIEDTQLMKQSKADLVAALQDVGVTQVSADTPLSEIAELMKWAGGLRDVTLACVSKADGSQAFFTRTQWDALSVTAKGSYIRIGVRVRAERTQFIVAKADALSKTGTTSMEWQPSPSSYTDVPGLTNFVANPAMFRDLDGEQSRALAIRRQNRPEPIRPRQSPMAAIMTRLSGLSQPSDRC